MASVFGIITTNEGIVEAALEKMARAGDPDQRRGLSMGAGWGVGVASRDPDGDLAVDENHGLCAAICGEVFGAETIGHRLAARGHALEGRGNAALLLHLYRDAGAEGLMELNGLFAGIIIHTTEPRAALVVDPIGGLRHLHYAAFKGGIVFASDIRQILATGLLAAEPDEDVVAGFFAHGHSLPPKTFFKGIGKVAPGTVVSCRADAATIDRVHELSFDTAAGDEAQHIERFEHALARAVELRSNATPAVGAFLSGGLDSSVNVALLSRALGPGVSTFAITYPQSRLDESPFARLVAEHCHTNHHELPLDSPDLLDELPTMVWRLEEPTMDSSFIPTYALARFARNITDTVISGDGPDHLLGRHYPVAVARSALLRVPGAAALANMADMAPALWQRLRASRSGRHLWKTLRSGSRSVTDAYLSIHRDIVWSALPPSRLESLLLPELFAHWSGGAESAPTSPSLRGLTPMQQIISLDLSLNGAFGVFAKMGKMAAAHGLTVREPFLDRNVCEIVCSLPAHMKVRGTRWQRLLNRATKKHVLREVARGIVPEEVLSKPKHGFEAPVGAWLRSWLQGRSVRRILPELTQMWIQPAFAQRLVDEHLAQVHDHAYLLLMLITTELWMRIFVREGGQNPSYGWRDYLDQ